MQDLGRLAADLLLFYTQEFAFVDAAGRVHHRLVDHAAEAQSRRVRAGARPHARWRRPASPKCWASSPSCRPAISATCSCIKPPLFRGIDLALPTRRHHGAAPSMACVSAPSSIKLDPAIHAAEEANALVAREGIPFREAYRRIGEKYRK